MPVSTTASVNGANYVFQAQDVEMMSDGTTGSIPQINFQLQYQNPAGYWVTYDNKYPDFHGLNNSSQLYINTVKPIPDYGNNRYQNPL